MIHRRMNILSYSAVCPRQQVNNVAEQSMSPPMHSSLQEIRKTWGSPSTSS